MMRAAPVAKAQSPGAQLDELLASRFLSRHWARRIWSAHELPAQLQRRVAQFRAESEWRAYSDDERVFFAVAQLHAPATRDCGASLDVYFLDGDGAVYSAAVWVNDPQKGWWLDAVLDASYDYEQGWWFEALSARPPLAQERAAQRAAHGAAQCALPSVPPSVLGRVARLSAPGAAVRKPRS